MNSVEKMIQELCPDGVEFVKLGEVCVPLKKGTLKQNELIEDGLYPVINSGRTIYGRYNNFNNEPDSFTIASRGEYAGFLNYFDEKYWAGGLCYPYKSKDLRMKTKFIYYYLKSKEEKIMGELVDKGSIPALNKGVIEKYEIPLPPLEIQSRIVEILDKFSFLAAELQAELQARRRQYVYYRDQLLSFEGRKDVAWKRLGDVATEMYRGAGIKRDEVSQAGVPCVRYGEIHTYYHVWFDKCISHTDESKQPSKKYAGYGDILFAITSEDVEGVGNCVAYVGEERIMVGGDIVVMRHLQNPEFLSYALSTTDAVKQKGRGKVKSKVVHTSVPSLQEIVIPIPPLAEQQRIVDILDRFDALCNDLTEGLPAEIAARQQQYEYYRDRLLTFKKK